jgi:predicted DNA-binding protein with PD1-like motif
MKYSRGSIGRIFLVRFEHGDSLLEEIKKLANKESISAATINFIGALSSGDIVTGPKKTELPPEPNLMSFDEGREVIGFGTVIKKNEGVTVHVHSSLGRGGDVLTGCLRGDIDVFVTIEAVVTEVKDIKVSKKKDKRTGIELLEFEQ